jgi:hypothetical protein
MQHPNSLKALENFDDCGGMGIMVCWVAASAPYKCMNMLLLWVLAACGTEAARPPAAIAG